MVDRDEQIRLMEGAEERANVHLNRWLARPEYQAMLRRYGGEAVEHCQLKVASGR